MKKITNLKKKQQTEKEDINNLKEEIDRITDQLQRQTADFANYKRRSEEERLEFVSFANAKILIELLPVFDNFKRATEHISEENKKDQWCQGILKIEKQFATVLKNIGVENVKTVGEKYDPELHEAVIQGESGKREDIIQELESGYMLNGKVLRPAKVMVGKD